LKERPANSPNGLLVFACKLGLKGIVSKRKDSTYRSGRSPDWLKMTVMHRREARSRGRVGQKEMTMTGNARIMIFGPKSDGTYVVEFRTAAGETLAISIPASETAVVRYFQERMPYGLFVPDLQEPK
jgi:hypothetical protein